MVLDLDNRVRARDRRLAAVVLALAFVAPAAQGAVPTSQLGVSVQPGELLVQPIVEYARDSNFEYDPAEFGFPSTGEFKGHYHRDIETLWVAYGLGQQLALDFGASAARATLDRAFEDQTGMPERTEESGLGNLRARLSWEWGLPRERRPAYFAFGEFFVPHDRKRVLTGTADWVFQFGVGASREFASGVLSVRAGVLFEEASASATDWGEVAVDYLARLSPRYAVLGALVVNEGDEVSLRAELRCAITPRIDLRVGSAVGLTSHGNDIAPEVGVLFRF